ncbi:MAG: hypothetical protein ACRC92_24155 [Peptostreptococcaceae bacterium]
MLNINKLIFEYKDKELNEKELVTFDGLRELFDNYLEYDQKTCTVQLSTDDIFSYSLQLTKDTTYNDIQDFFELSLDEEGIGEIIEIKVVH